MTTDPSFQLRTIELF